MVLVGEGYRLLRGKDFKKAVFKDTKFNRAVVSVF